MIAPIDLVLLLLLFSYGSLWVPSTVWLKKLIQIWNNLSMTKLKNN